MQTEQVQQSKSNARTDPTAALDVAVTWFFAKNLIKYLLIRNYNI